MGMLFGKTSSSCFLPVNGPVVLQLRVSPPLFPYPTLGESKWLVIKLNLGRVIGHSFFSCTLFFLLKVLWLQRAQILPQALCLLRGCLTWKLLGLWGMEISWIPQFKSKASKKGNILPSIFILCFISNPFNNPWIRNSVFWQSPQKFQQ